MSTIAKRCLGFFGLALLVGAATLGAQDPEDVPLTLDEEYARLAEQVPGFGGLYLDERGTTHVYLLDPARAPEVQDLGERVEVHQGQYDFRDLFAWKEEVRPLLSRESMVSLDIDEQRNRLVLGALESAVGELQAELPALLRGTSVPPAAVIVEAGELPKTEVDLIDLFRPVPAGVQISSSSGQCTLGVNVTRGGVRGFVTNSHCTLARSFVEGTVFLQHNLNPANRIGVETADPAYILGGKCPAGRQCRYSDAAFVAYDSEDLSEGGNIALPIYCDTGSSTLTVGQGVPRLPIVGVSIKNPASGKIVYKVGRTTGCTFGSLKETCSDRVVGLEVNGMVVPTNVIMLCQNLTTAGAGNGDSGSPVFRRSGNEAILLGLHWGSFPSRAIYSPWASVVMELGLPVVPDEP